jgi:nitrite reductase/ring-hydroxylating ferredoxin subunit/uncharacterized membrane protein
MGAEPPVDVIEQQEWLEPVETGLQNAVSGAYEAGGSAGRAVKNFVHGVWLGHPLHPVLTDIPLGAWTATLVLDVAEWSGQKNCAKGADWSLRVGLAGAAGAAVAGLTDWQATDGPARRVGVVHGLLNLASVGLYAASLLARNRRNRDAGRGLALAGFVVSSAAAWLGGNLVYGKQIGVNHTAATPYPEEWTPAMDEASLREGEPTRVDLPNAVRVLLLKRVGKIYAIAEVCSHLGGPLAEGKLEGDCIECPWHGSRFSMRDGKVLDGPATHPQPILETRVVNGRIEVKGWSQE